MNFCPAVEFLIRKIILLGLRLLEGLGTNHIPGIKENKTTQWIQKAIASDLTFVKAGKRKGTIDGSDNKTV